MRKQDSLQLPQAIKQIFSIKLIEARIGRVRMQANAGIQEELGPIQLDKVATCADFIPTTDWKKEILHVSNMVPLISNRNYIKLIRPVRFFISEVSLRRQGPPLRIK